MISEGPPPYAILLHGGPGFEDYLKPLNTLLKRTGRSFVRYSQRGTHPSPSGGPFSVAAHVADLDKIRCYLNQEHVSLIGHSWGANLALHYASSHPDHVRDIVAITPAWMNQEEAVAFRDALRARLPPIERGRVLKIEAELGVTSLSDDRLTDLYDERFRLLWRAYFRGPAPGCFIDGINGRVAVESWRDSASIIEDPATETQLAVLKVSTLIIEAEFDPVPRSSVERIGNLLSTSSIVTIPECGHFPWIEEPAALFDAVQEFWASKE
jgi:proline iminopeptidase